MQASLSFKFAVAIWPVTGQGFQNTKWPAAAVNFTNKKKTANLNHHMPIKKSQAILKRFIDLKFSIWFMLGSENEAMFCDT